MTDDRYTRQSRLLEVGAEGQARIEAMRARITAGPGAAVALAYLVRAGVGSASIERSQASAFPHRAWFEFQSSLSVARGAHHALLELKRALQSKGEGS